MGCTFLSAQADTLAKQLFLSLLEISHAVAAAAVGASGAAALVARFYAASAARLAALALAGKDVDGNPAAPDASGAAGLSCPVAAVPALDALHCSPSVASGAVSSLQTPRLRRRNVPPAPTCAVRANNPSLSAASRTDGALHFSAAASHGNCSRSVAAGANRVSLSAAGDAWFTQRHGRKGKAHSKHGGKSSSHSLHLHSSAGATGSAASCVSSFSIIICL